MSAPTITRVEWINASSVLGHEERGFSAWLANNLDLLAEALGLDGLSLVGRETRVETFRADIVALADDGSDDGLPVVIENQYGRANHDHLGKLVTYLAARQRGLGVWIVEEPTEAHAAAVEFLNRTSDETVGYALVVVRFAPAPNGAHYVDFDVIARPNPWVKSGGGTSSRSASPERAAFLQAVYEHAQQPLLEAGWRQVVLRTDRPHIQLRLSDDHPLSGRGYFTLRASPASFGLRHVVTVDSLDQSQAIVAALHETYGDRLREVVPEGTELRWHAGVQRANAVNDQWQALHPDGGYEHLDPVDAAEWAVSVCGAWARLLIEDPPDRLLSAVRARKTDGPQ